MNLVIGHEQLRGVDSFFLGRLKGGSKTIMSRSSNWLGHDSFKVKIGDRSSVEILTYVFNFLYDK